MLQPSSDADNPEVGWNKRNARDEDKILDQLTQCIFSRQSGGVGGTKCLLAYLYSSRTDGPEKKRTSAHVLLVDRISRVLGQVWVVNGAFREHVRIPIGTGAYGEIVVHVEVTAQFYRRKRYRHCGRYDHAWKIKRTR